jgi:hypothetical protein
MTRLPLLALCAAAAFAAPAPKRTEPESYFPTTVGARWVYERAGGREEIAEVSEVEKVDGEVVVSRQGIDGSVTRYTKMVVTPKGLRQDQFNGGPSSVWVLRTDLRPGSSWDTPEGKRTVFGPERIEVPAGKFNALRVEWEQDGSQMVSWYAPTVGEVKRVEKRGGEEVVFRLLKAFKAK